MQYQQFQDLSGMGQEQIDKQRIVQALMLQKQIADKQLANEDYGTTDTAARGHYPGFSEVNYGGIINKGYNSYNQAKGGYGALDASANQEGGDLQAVLDIINNANGGTQNVGKQVAQVDMGGNLNSSAPEEMLTDEQLMEMAGNNRQVDVDIKDPDMRKQVLEELMQTGATQVPAEQQQQATMSDVPRGANYGNADVQDRQANYTDAQLYMLSRLQPENAMIKALVESNYGGRRGAGDGFGATRAYYINPDDPNDIMPAVLNNGREVDSRTGKPIPFNAIPYANPNTQLNQSPTNKADIKTAEKTAEIMAKNSTDALVNLKDVRTIVGTNLELLNSMKNDPGLKTALDTRSIGNDVLKYFDPYLANFMSKMEQQTNKEWIRGFREQFADKGAGQMTETEGARIIAAYTRLNGVIKSGKIELFSEAMDEVKDSWIAWENEVERRAMQSSAYDEKIHGKSEEKEDDYDSISKKLYIRVE